MKKLFFCSLFTILLVKCVFLVDDCSDFIFTLPQISLPNLTNQINSFIDHYKIENPIGVPIPLPDPFPLDEIHQKMYGYDLKMFNNHATGISSLHLHNVSLQLDEKIEISCGISFDALKMSGNYTLKSNFGSTSSGPFTIKIEEMEILGLIKVAAEKRGMLRVKEVVLNADVTRMDLQLENISGLAGFVTNLLKAGEKTFFNLIKSNLMKEGQNLIKIQIDEKLAENLGENFIVPNSIATIDFAISEARKFIRKCNDPYKVPDYIGDGMVGISLLDTELRGLSTFHRIGELRAKILNNKIYLTFDLGTQQLKGKTNWELSMLKGVLKRRGKLQFSVDFLRVSCAVHQPFDLSKNLKIDDLQLEMGNIQVLSDGLGTLDYLLELFVNTIPNLLRFQLMDALEKPLKARIQDFADKIDAEKLIKWKLRELEATGSMTMNLNKFEL